MLQDILVLLIIITAILYLGYRFLSSKKRGTCCSGCGNHTAGSCCRQKIKNCDDATLLEPLNSKKE